MGTPDFSIHDYLKTKLKVVKLNARKTETNIRCPFCGDSKKSQYSAHLYIKNEPPFAYYCQRCTNSGVVTDKFLNLLQVYDADFSASIREKVTSYMLSSGSRYKKKFVMERELDFTPPETLTPAHLAKLQYVEHRIGVTIPLEELGKYRLILDIYDFCQKNRIDVASFDRRTQALLQRLNEQYVMFMTHDRSLLNCRNLYPKDKNNRFYKIYLFEDEGDSGRFYCLANDLDLTQRTFQIHIAEGIFDILSVYHNVRGGEMDSSTLYIANNGKGYLYVLEYLARLGILNCDIHIYCDSDVKLPALKRLLRYSTSAQVNGVRVYYNEYTGGSDGKVDFGVPRDQIQISQPTLLTNFTT